MVIDADGKVVDNRCHIGVRRVVDLIRTWPRAALFAVPSGFFHYTLYK
jgi:hypothetical protein